ncbi:hypothetical protein [Peristeroidobacter agariperforans]|uniref:hypothetical protein n=1 Tax=Peristeroidobacter agariperforans TaxID=268404 RepID=UPI00101CFF00|nr:hypothetical protein [Peristeroidobacter agariperforans]
MKLPREAIAPILIALAACTAGTPDAPISARSGQPTVVDGTVRYVAVEGGCWIIETAHERVQPVDLPERFRVDGKAVRVTLRDAPDMMSVCQVGPLKHVETMTAR